MPPALSLDSPLDSLPRVSAADLRRLQKLGLRNVRDLLLYLPFGWEAYGEPVALVQVTPGSQATVLVEVERVAAKRTPRRRMQLTEAVVRDDSGGRLAVVWFNQPYLARQLHAGDRLALAGLVRPSRFGPGLEMQNPHHEVVGREGGPRRIGGLMPKYHLTEGLTSRRMAGWVEASMPVARQLEDIVPEETRARHHLLPVADAVRSGHRPESEAEWREARRRMAFAELLELQAAFLLARSRIAVERATAVPYRQEVIDRFKAGLGFELTRAQRRATWEVYQDLQEETPMNRLLNGDVGSGKTAVAAAAAAMVHAAGMQTVVMAPTEILARQHLEKFRAYLEASFPGLTVELLVSGLSAPERRRVRTAAASGHCAVLVGTHALIEDEVELASLGLAVVDEQHRFGTRQRELLRGKSASARPHFLAMTATPIPRSLALALYGEMALSTLDELPPGRTPVATAVVNPDQREQAYELVRREVQAGRQAFVICPLIEESESSEARAATAEFERLRTKIFPDLRLALVHGRLKDKDEVMRRFKARESDVLVATAVVEVGVDVPNATVMLIEGAERFGLAQLHQFRGRVGRGSAQSTCLLLAEEPSSKSMERLNLLAHEHNGFRLATEDMRLRGAGELMGARQHGMSDLAMEGLGRPELLSEVRQEAERVLESADAELLREAARRRLEQTAIS
ncbi:MAG: ATP-dependent DNA helicase RecG [Candidatus Dormibacteraeota bacterium]|nr:ATP-dependent DNA helicase RecG [Candidatus Dormibacteraeota bacterium]